MRVWAEVGISLPEHHIELIETFELKLEDRPIHASDPIDIDFSTRAPVTGIDLVEDFETFGHFQGLASIAMID